MGEYWSWGLTGLGMLTLYLAGNGRRSAWALGMAAQLAWIAYALATGQPGFVVAALGYGAMYARNWIKSGREEGPL